MSNKINFYIFLTSFLITSGISFLKSQEDLEDFSLIENFRYATEEELIQYLQSKDFLIKYNTILAIGHFKIFSSKVISSLIEAFKDEIISTSFSFGTNIRGIIITDRDNLREQIAWTLGEIAYNIPEAILALTQSLQDKNKYVRYKAAEALSKIDPTSSKKIISILCEAIDDEDIYSDIAFSDKPFIDAIRVWVKIGKSDPETTISKLVEILKNKTWSTRCIAAEILTQITNEEYKPPPPNLIEKLFPAYYSNQFLKNMSNSTGLLEFQILNLNEKASLIPDILLLLQNKDRNRRYKALSILNLMVPKEFKLIIDNKISLKGIEIISILYENLKDTDVSIRMFSAEILYKITKDRKNTLPIFIQMLEHENFFIRSESIRALWIFGFDAKEEFSTLLQIAQKEKMEVIRTQLMYVLEYINTGKLPWKKSDY